METSVTEITGQERRNPAAEALASPDWLTDHLSDPDLRVVEVDVSSVAYDQWHIDGAILWNVYTDLKDADYRLVGPEDVQALFERSGIGPGKVDVIELHDATCPEELFSLESLGFFAPGEAGPATEAGATGVDTPGLVVNPSGGLVGRGHPLGATGLAQVVELATQIRGRAGERQVASARTGVAVNTGGIIYGDAGFVGIHVVAAGG